MDVFATQCISVDELFERPSWMYFVMWQVMTLKKNATSDECMSR